MSDKDYQDDDEENWMETEWADANEHGQTRSPYEGSKLFTSMKTGSFNSNKAKVGKEALKDLPTSEYRNPSCQEGSSCLMNRMKLNDNKAGMDGLDKEKINQIIMEASKGSRFYENERKKEVQMNKRIEEQKLKLQQITDIQLKQGLIEADRLLEELEDARDLSKTIVHVDMDAFYAAVEMRDNPVLKDKPMAVGGMSMLSTSNYHARKFGVRAAMPGFIGKKLCPDLIIVPLNFDKYTEVSKQVREIFAEYDPNFSPVSLDEAYLDISEHLEKRLQLSEYERTFLCRKTDGCSKTLCNCDLNLKLKLVILRPEMNGKSSSDSIASESKNIKVGKDISMCPLCGRPYPDYDILTFGMSPDDAVNEMRIRIQQKTRLTASAGIAPNTMLAKVCSDKNKPNGQYRILPERDKVMEFITDLPTRKISGIGKVSDTMLNAIGVYTCNDLYNQRALLYHLYSQISFNYFMRICLGIGSTFVERDSEKKSVSTERTFNEISKPSDLLSKCEELSIALSEDLKDEELKGRTVAIKIKTVEFEVKTRAHTLADYTNETDVIYGTAKELLKTEIQAVYPQPLRLRLMGVRMSSLLHQSLCKKKQNTITGFIKRIGNEKVKPKQVNEKSCDINATETYKTENTDVNQHGILEKSCDVHRKEENKDHSQFWGKQKLAKFHADNSENENNSPTKRLHHMENKRHCWTDESHNTTDTQEVKSKDFDDSLSSDSGGESERQADFDMSLINCNVIEVKCLNKDKNVRTKCLRNLQKVTDLTVEKRKDSFKETSCSVKESNTVINDNNIKSFDVESVDCDTETLNTYMCPVCQTLIDCEDLMTFNQHIDVCLNKQLVKDCTKIAHDEDRNSKRSVSSPKKKNKSLAKKNVKPFSPISPSLVSQFCKHKNEDDIKLSKRSNDNLKQKITDDESLLINTEGYKEDAKITDVVTTPDKKGTKNLCAKNNKKKSSIISAPNKELNILSDCTEMIENLNSSSCLMCPVCFMEQKGNDLVVFNEHVDTCLSKDAITDIVRSQGSNISKSQKRTLESTPDKPAKKRQRTNSGLRTIDSFFKT